LAPIRAIAFDCYGTLIKFDTESFIEAFNDILRDQGLSADPKALWDRWLDSLREAQAEAQADPEALATRADPPFAPYRETWVDHFRAAFRAVGVEGDPDAATEYLHRLLGEADAYPEAREVVETLRGRYRLALVSNADDDWLYACLHRNGLADWEVAVSSEEVRAYKPHPAIYQEALRRLGLPPAEVLYVGDSPLADVFGAQHAGMPVVWINRHDTKLPEKVPPPVFTISNLAELPDVLRRLDTDGAK
jgi:2-haloalkanoic acid dehalogenase type II